MDDLSRFLPDDPARGVCLLRRCRAPSLGSRTGYAAHGATRRELRAAAHHPRRALEAAWDREPFTADPRPAFGDDRVALFPALDYEPARPGLVRAKLSGPEPLSDVRAVQPGFASRALRLSLRAPTARSHAKAILRVVGGLRRFRVADSCLGVVPLAFAAPGARHRRSGRRRNRDRATSGMGSTAAVGDSRCHR